MNTLSIIQEITIWILPVLLAIIVHEVAHGWVANIFGDKTALLLGRLTLNPFKHIELIGTIIMPLLCAFFNGPIFGWAKPVPINPRNFSNFKLATILVAIAGPLSNLLMAIMWAAIIKITLSYFPNEFDKTIKLFVIHMGYAGVSINLFLMILNLIPIPPLDGSKVVEQFLPVVLHEIYQTVKPFGFVILILLLSFNILSVIINPIYNWLQQIIFSFINI